MKVAWKPFHSPASLIVTRGYSIVNNLDVVSRGFVDQLGNNRGVLDCFPAMPVSTTTKASDCLVGQNCKYKGKLLYLLKSKKAGENDEESFDRDDSHPLNYRSLYGQKVQVLYRSPEGFYTIEYNASSLNELASKAQVFCWVRESELK